MKLRQIMTASVAIAVAVGGLVVGAGAAQADSVTYTASQTIPVPPATDYAGGDG